MRLLKEVLKSASDQSKENNEGIEITGPLGDAYTKALNIVFAKRKEGEAADGAALESQANDAIMQSDFIKLASGIDTANEKNNSTKIYGVSASDVQNEDVVEFATVLADPQVDPNNVILVLDATKMAYSPKNPNNITEYFINPGLIEENISNELSPVMESIARRLGCKVTNSLEGALKLLR